MTGPQQAKRSFRDKLAYLIETVHPFRPRSAANRGSTTFCGRPASPIPGTSTTFSTGLNVIVAPGQPSLVHIDALDLGRGCGLAWSLPGSTPPSRSPWTPGARHWQPSETVVTATVLCGPSRPVEVLCCGGDVTSDASQHPGRSVVTRVIRYPPRAHAALSCIHSLTRRVADERQRPYNMSTFIYDQCG